MVGFLLLFLFLFFFYLDALKFLWETEDAIVIPGTFCSLMTGAPDPRGVVPPNLRDRMKENMAPAMLGIHA